MIDFMNFNFYYFVIETKKKKKYTCNTFSLSLNSNCQAADVYAKNYIFYEMEMKFKRRFIGEYHKHVERQLKIKKKNKKLIKVKK